VDGELKVLLVEDDPEVAEMYRFRLEVDGYRVVVAPDGETALRLASEDPPDLVYLDLRLPTIDGFAVLEALRADPRTGTVPVVILTNFSDPEQVERGRRLGAMAYLVKAETSPSALADRMEQWLREEAVTSRAQPA
jgi:DNA-binding response OmpR family regulator